MAISVTAIGTNSNTTGGTLAITVGVGGVPSGALIVCCTVERTVSATTPGTIADTALNTYTSITNAQLNGNNGPGGPFYVKNATALVNTNTITYTKKDTLDCAFSAIYATGIDTTAPLDTAVTASATGSSISPTVTSGIPAVSGELFVGFVNHQGISSYTQDATHSWTTTNSDVQTGTGVANRGTGEGDQVNAGTGTKIYAPTLGNGANWAAFVVGFKPASVAGFFSRYYYDMNRAGNV